MGSPAKKQFPLRLDPALWEEIERLREALKRRGIKPALSPAPRRGRPPAGDAATDSETAAAVDGEDTQAPGAPGTVGE